MSPIWVNKTQSAPNIGPGTYTLEVRDLREVEVADFEDPNQKVRRIELTFIIRSNKSWQGKQFSDLFSPRMGPISRLGQVTAALNGGKWLPDGDNDLEALKGRRMRATIRLKANGYNQIIAETAVPVEEPDEEVTD